MSLPDLNHETTIPLMCKEELDKLDLRDLAMLMATIGARIALLKKESSQLNDMLELISMVVVPEKMEQAGGLSTTTIRGIGRITVKGDMFCNVPAEKRDILHAWLEEHDYESLIKPAVNSSSLKALIKELSQSEDEEEVTQWEEIQDIVIITPYLKASLTKA